MRRLTDSVRSLLDKWNQDLGDRQRYDAVMNAPSDSLFRMDKDKNMNTI